MDSFDELSASSSQVILAHPPCHLLPSRPQCSTSVAAGGSRIKSLRASGLRDGTWRAQHSVVRKAIHIFCRRDLEEREREDCLLAFADMLHLEAHETDRARAREERAVEAHELEALRALAVLDATVGVAAWTGRLAAIRIAATLAAIRIAALLAALGVADLRALRGIIPGKRSRGRASHCRGRGVRGGVTFPLQHSGSQHEQFVLQHSGLQHSVQQLGGHASQQPSQQSKPFRWMTQHVGAAGQVPAWHIEMKGAHGAQQGLAMQGAHALPISCWLFISGTTIATGFFCHGSYTYGILRW